MLRIIMFKNLGFERLRITSPCLYHAKVKTKNFKKRGASWMVGMVSAGVYPPHPTLARFVLDAARNQPPPSPLLAGSVPTCRFQAIKKK